jgi:hypothetical protein
VGLGELVSTQSAHVGTAERTKTLLKGFNGKHRRDGEAEEGGSVLHGKSEKNCEGHVCKHLQSI